jgi:hypothetical protein
VNGKAPTISRAKSAIETCYVSNEAELLSLQ